MTTKNLSYDEACAHATTAQGLDPIVEVLEADGLPVVVEQTGGFCMVATIYGADGTWLGFTNEDPTGPEAAFLVCFYAHEEDDGKIVAEPAELDHIVDAARKFVAEHGVRAYPDWTTTV